MKTQSQKTFRIYRKIVGRDKDLETQPERDAVLRVLSDMMNLAKQVALEVAPIIEANRDAHERMFSYSARNEIENSEELYGRSVMETRKKYGGDVLSYRAPGASVDCEVSEVEQGLLASMGHNEAIGAGAEES